MINEPVTLVKDSFQQAWLEVVKRLMISQWRLRNLTVQIRRPEIFCGVIDQQISEFASREGLLGPRHVAYTIFPENLYYLLNGAGHVFRSYNRKNGWYERTKRKTPSTWGTYFRRMTHYERDGHEPVNQLEKIINAINTRKDVHGAAYTIVLQQPGADTARKMGGPCLNYIAVQMESGNPPLLGMLAVYRNHDFLKRAYGNYWGLCNLIKFLARETKSDCGPLTCVSSRAYVDGKKTALKTLIEGL